MFWPALVIFLLAVLVALHFWWSARYAREKESALREVQRLGFEQQQAAVQIQSQQDALFNSMVEGLLVLDETGRIQLANRAFGELFGAGADIRSRTILEALRLHELAELVEQLSADKQVLEHELRLSGPPERWIQVNGAAIFNGDKRRHGTVLVFHELTRLKQLESARKEFVANVSHELRTPLSLIKGYVETLLDGAKDNPQVASRFLLTIERNAERLKLLIEDLLTLSELESGRIKLNLQSVPLNSLLEKILDDFKSKTAAKNVSLINKVPELYVRADSARLEQVFGNLIDNAIKYGHPNGKVVITGRLADQGQFELCVQDDGPGIPVEALERIFERFYRVDKARSREQGGTGLGLSIVKHIVQNHGGKVWAKSDLGRGAAFYFTLPPDSGLLQQRLL